MQDFLVLSIGELNVDGLIISEQYKDPDENVWENSRKRRHRKSAGVAIKLQMKV